MNKLVHFAEILHSKLLWWMSGPYPDQRICLHNHGWKCLEHICLPHQINAAGTDISTSLLALASKFLKKGLSGKYILGFTCPNGQADFLNIKHIFLIFKESGFQIFKSMINNTCLSSIYFGQVKKYVGQVKIINYLPDMAC